MPAKSNGTTGKRFELPALDFKFGSLTEGTDIPPPPPSPPLQASVPATTPRTTITPTKSMLDIGNAAKAPVSNGKKANVSLDPSPSPAPTQATLAGTKRPAADSPTSSTTMRPGSIRRMFSRKTLNTSYQDGEKTSPIQRPVSRLSTATSPDGKKIKRSSSWFSRLMSSESVNKTSTSTPTSPVVEKRKPSGPPPPKLPELTKVQENDGLGEDLFKNIK